ncbi:hypothetical protein GJ496_001786, partial [Pomphorhynchus laevis]
MLSGHIKSCPRDATNILSKISVNAITNSNSKTESPTHQKNSVSMKTVMHAGEDDMTYKPVNMVNSSNHEAHVPSSGEMNHIKLIAVSTTHADPLTALSSATNAVSSNDNMKEAYRLPPKPNFAAGNIYIVDVAKLLNLKEKESNNYMRSYESEGSMRNAHRCVTSLKELQ